MWCFYIQLIIPIRHKQRAKSDDGVPRRGANHCQRVNGLRRWGANHCQSVNGLRLCGANHCQSVNDLRLCGANHLHSVNDLRRNGAAKWYFQTGAFCNYRREKALKTGTLRLCVFAFIFSIHFSDSLSKGPNDPMPVIHKKNTPLLLTKKIIVTQP